MVQMVKELKEVKERLGSKEADTSSSFHLCTFPPKNTICIPIKHICSHKKALLSKGVKRFVTLTCVVRKLDWIDCVNIKSKNLNQETGRLSL